MKKELTTTLLSVKIVRDQKEYVMMVAGTVMEKTKKIVVKWINKLESADTVDAFGRIIPTQISFTLNHRDKRYMMLKN